MTDLMKSNNQLTMSSREIAQVVESRHDNVKRTMESLRARGLIAFTQTEEKTIGRPAAVYWVGKRDSYVIVAQLSPEFTARLVDRWQELEQRELVPAWARNISEEARIALEDLSAQVDHYRQETERLNSVCNDLAANLKSGITPPAFCRMLNGVNVNRVQPLLVERKRLIKTAHGYRSASAHRDKLFTERRELNQDGRLCEKVVLTLKGAKWLYSEYEKGHLEMKKDWDGLYSHLILEQEAAA